MAKATSKKKAVSKAAAKKKVTKKTAKKTAAKKVAAKKTASKATASKKTPKKAATAKATPAAKSKKKAVAKKAAAKKPAAKKTATKKTASKKVAAKVAAKKAPKSAVAKKAAAKKTASKTSKKVTATVKEKATTADTQVASKKSSKSVKASAPNISVSDAIPSEVVPYERDKNSHYMDEKQLAYFSEKLAQWKQQLMEEVDRTVGHMKDDATNFPDPNDRATQEEEFSLELRTRDRERKLIKKINEAQKRIEDDDYGYCETCGVEIGVGRLEARPTAELCFDCKTLEEIRERQIA